MSAALSTRILNPGEKIRVMVVDDSVVIRRLVVHALESDPRIEVVGVASNGAIALTRIPHFSPDVITLDIEMPEMDGLEMLRQLRPQYPGIRVVMFSTLTERGASATLEALARGADDYVTKASNAGSLDVSLATLKTHLLPKIHQFFAAPEGGAATAARPQLVRRPELEGSAGPARTGPMKASKPEVVAIGISTGGPSALALVMPDIPGDFPLPIMIVQHMPPLFTRLLAERLDANCRLQVREAEQGDLLEPGKVYIAPGDYHMKLARRAAGVEVVLDQSPPENSCRPAVDVLFRSVREVYGGAVIGAVLTGMGQDGKRGCEVLKAAGAHILAQDEPSSVVWGMPGAVVGAGLADQVVPLNEIAPVICRQAGL